MTTTTYTTIEVERVGPVERITLNRPHKRNALTVQLQDELLAAVRTAETAKEVRVIIIRGAGPSFCSGHDMGGDTDDSPPTVEEDLALALGVSERWGRIWNCRIPVIAQLHGHCIAGGTDLALHCDLLVVADDAQIGYPPVRAQGVPPTHMWIYHVGPQWSKRLLLTGDTISGRQAEKIGLAVESVPAEQLDDHVMRLAQRIACCGHDVLVHNKRMVNQAVELMGRTQLQTFAGIHEVLGHLSPEAQAFTRRVRESGLRAALVERDKPFQEE